MEAEGGVVGGEDCECPVGETSPDGFLVEGTLAWGRTADAFCALKPISFEVGGGEIQVLRTCLAMDRNSPSLCIADMFDGRLVSASSVGRAYRSRNVNQENGNLNDLTQTNCSVCRLGFDDWRTRSIVVIRFSHSLLFKFLGHPFHDLSVLGMDHGREIVLTGREHDIEEFPVPQLEGFVCHVQLARRNSVSKQLGEISIKRMRFRGYQVSSLSGRGNTSDNEMEAIIAVRIPGGFAVILINDINKGPILFLSLLLCER